ncbi:MAG: hypothetical protein RLZZ66_774 [Pseudomonadota bacterium]
MAKNDKTAPKLISVNPKKGESAIALNQLITFMFNEDIQAGSGNIVLSNGVDTRKIPLTSTQSSSTQFTITGKLLTLNLADKLLPNSLYSVKIDTAAIEDLSGNKYAGINNATTYYFNTVDTLAPILATSSPLANSSNFAVNSNIVLTFNEKIQAGIGNITLESNTDLRTISILDNQVKISGKTLTLNPTIDLNTNSTYKLTISAGAIKDLAPVSNSNNSVELIYTTKTIGDKQAPVLESHLIAGSAKDNLHLSFQEAIKIGKGNFTLSDGSTSVTIPVNDPQVSITNNVLTINPTNDLNAEKIYTLTAPKGIITDLANNAFSGLTTKAPFTFDARDKVPPTLMISDDLNTTINSEVHYMFTSSEPLKEFTIDDISVEGGIKGEFKSVTGTNNFTLSVMPKPNSIESMTVTVATGAFTDLVGNKNVVGAQNSQTVDTLQPLLQGSTPADESSYFSNTGNLVLIFDENVFTGSGNFVISNGSDVQTISVDDDKQVVINNKIVTINPARDLIVNTNYHLTFASGVLTDKVGNNFAGLTLSTQLNFNTDILSMTPKDTTSEVQVFTDKLNAKALDGYLKNATVFADANGDGIQNADEATAITDEYGNFELMNAKGTLVVSGGTDLSTGNPFEGTLKAPEGSTVVTPLTTMLQGFIEAKQTPAEAQKSVAEAFGFDSTIDLTSYDPIAGMVNSDNTPSTQTTATQIMSSSAQIANFLVTAGRVLQGAAGDNGNLTTQNASDSLIKSLVNSVKTANGAINLSDSTLLKTVLVDGAKEVNKQAQISGLPPRFDPANFTDKIDKMADTVTAVLKGAADNIINAVKKSNAAEPLALLTNMDKISKFAQNEAGKSLQQIAVALDIKDDVASKKVLQNQVNLLTGLTAEQAIEKNVVQTVKSVPDILAADKAIKNAPPLPGTNNPNNPGAPAPNNPGAPATNNPGAPAPNNSGVPATNNPDAPATNNPGAPVTNNPGAPATNNPDAPAPNNPGAPAPNNPGAPATNNPGAPAPNNPDAQAPNNPGAQAPNNPGAPVTNNPGALVTNNPDAQAPNNPGAPATNNPDAPATNNPGAPVTNNPDAPAPNNPDAPATNNPGAQAPNNPGTLSSGNPTVPSIQITFVELNDTHPPIILVGSSMDV